MYGTWVLLILIFISSFPVIAVYVWFRAAKYQVSIVWFFAALLTGAAAFLPALLFQDLLAGVSITQSRTALLFDFFIRIAFTEEFSRLLLLFAFFWISGMISKKNCLDKDLNQKLTFNSVKKGTAAGLIAGFGFSILENTGLAASGMEISVIILRAVFTASIHGACGSRIGAAAVLLRANPFQSLLRLITAVAIHGVYNIMVTIPGIPSIAAFIIAASTLITAILGVRGVKFNSED